MANESALRRRRIPTRIPTPWDEHLAAPEQYDHTGACEKNTPPKKKTREVISFENAKSGAGEQFLLLDCRARACAKGVFISQTPVRYVVSVSQRCAGMLDSPSFVFFSLVELLQRSVQHAALTTTRVITSDDQGFEHLAQIHLCDA